MPTRHARLVSRSASRAADKVVAGVALCKSKVETSAVAARYVFRRRPSKTATDWPASLLWKINEGPVVGSDELADLTERFTRAGATRAPGTGLGLSIVDQIMRQAGGRLDLASPAPGKKDGFAARLVFPAKPAEPGR